MTARSVRRLTVLCCIALMIASVPRSDAEEVTIRQILENPSRYDGESIATRGTVKNLTRRTSRKGDRYYMFDLSDGSRAIAVVMAGQPACVPGAPVTVYGRVEATRRSSNISAILTARRVECR